MSWPMNWVDLPRLPEPVLGRLVPVLHELVAVLVRQHGVVQVDLGQPGDRPQEDVLDEAVKLAEAVTANGPLAVKAIKTLVRAATTLPPAEVWALQDELQPGVFGSEDAREGAAAFVEKRPPVWKAR